MWSDDGGYASRERLIDLLGPAAAARVVDVFGGGRIYVPEPDAESFGPIARKLGEDIARALCGEFGGMRIDTDRLGGLIANFTNRFRNLFSKRFRAIQSGAARSLPFPRLVGEMWLGGQRNKGLIARCKVSPM